MGGMFRNFSEDEEPEEIVAVKQAGASNLVLVKHAALSLKANYKPASPQVVKRLFDDLFRAVEKAQEAAK